MKALIAMSGGVDSSVAAMLTKKMGYECIGCTMKLLNDDTFAEETEPEISDAEAVARDLDMPFYTFDMRDEFRNCVIEDFVDQYSKGRTPNPCIVCNRHMKFGALLEKATELGCDKIVTGHYARVLQDSDTGLYTLKKGLDESKDQSYVLYHLTQDQLSHILLPLGELSKAQVRSLASDSGFVNAQRPESQDICFVPDGKYTEKICEYSHRDYPPGDFVDLQGNVIGTHKGIIHYTIGQHKRLGQAFGVPRYVCAIDAAANRVVLGGGNDVFSSQTTATDCCWISGIAPKDEIRCRVRLRYKQKEQWATVRPMPGVGGGDGEKSASLKSLIIFDEPQRAITPGQAAVFYDDDVVLGGGTIL